MSTWQERRSILKTNNNAKIVWIIIFVLQCVGALAILLFTFAASLFSGLSGSNAITAVVTVVAVLILALAVLILFGLWRLERWVVWLMWLNVLASLPSLLSKQFWQGLIPIFVAIGYTWILRIVYPKSPSVPVAPVSPPPSNPTIGSNP